MKVRNGVDSQSPFDIVTERAPIDDVARIADAVLPTRHGEFRIAVFHVAGIGYEL